MSSLEFSDDENDVDLHDTSATSSGLVSIVYCTPTEAIPLKTSLAQPVLPPSQEGDGTTEIDEMSEKELSALKEASIAEPDDDQTIARNLQCEFNEAYARQYQSQLQNALARMDSSMIGWDFREEVLSEEAQKSDVLLIDEDMIAGNENVKKKMAKPCLRLSQHFVRLF